MTAKKKPAAKETTPAPEEPKEELTPTEQEADKNAAESRQEEPRPDKVVDAFVDAYADLLHPTAVQSSYIVRGKDQLLLGNLLRQALADGWTLSMPPEPEQEEDETSE